MVAEHFWLNARKVLFCFWFLCSFNFYLVFNQLSQILNSSPSPPPIPLNHLQNIEFCKLQRLSSSHRRKHLCQQYFDYSSTFLLPSFLLPIQMNHLQFPRQNNYEEVVSTVLGSPEGKTRTLPSAHKRDISDQSHFVSSCLVILGQGL